MDDNLDRLISRRSFLRRGSCATLGLAGLGSQLLTSRAMAAVLDGQKFNDYKALVCVFLFGGNDNGNTLIPISGGEQNYADYAKSRSQLAIPARYLAGSRIKPVNAGGQTFALHPALSGVRRLFNEGNAAVLANVGTLV
ncbi:MAG: twin-arginine translocation signal domain-containing protein, partial [Planctomycetota bacterium]